MHQLAQLNHPLSLRWTAPSRTGQSAIDPFHTPSALLPHRQPTRPLHTPGEEALAASILWRHAPTPPRGPPRPEGAFQISLPGSPYYCYLNCNGLRFLRRDRPNSSRVQKSIRFLRKVTESELTIVRLDDRMIACYAVNEALVAKPLELACKTRGESRGRYRWVVLTGRAS